MELLSARNGSASGGERLLKWLVGAAAACVVVGAMRVAAPLLTQVLVVLFLTIILSPVYYLFRRVRIPPRLSAALLVLLMVGGCLWALWGGVYPAVMEFTKKAGGYHKEFLEALDDLTVWLRENGVNIPNGYLKQRLAFESSQVSRFGLTALSWLGGFVRFLVVVLIIASFAIFELPGLPRAVRRARWLSPARREILTRFVVDVRHYLGIKTVISAFTGFFIYLGLLAIGVDSPLLLGFVAFALNYVPVFGSIIAAAPGVLLALNAGGGVAAAWTVALYVAVNQVLGNILEPRIMGTGFGVSPVVVLLSVAFWGWVLGPVGMLFAVPLTMAVRGTVVSMWGGEGEAPPAALPASAAAAPAPPPPHSGKGS